MSLIHDVVNFVRAQGSATVDELCAAMSVYSRKQIGDALKNAKTRGYVHCEGRVPCRGAWRGGSLPSRHFPGPKPPDFQVRRESIAMRPPASVWELSHSLQIAGSWPPASHEGRRYLLLSAGDEPAEVSP